jgi:6-phosphofructokinase 1
LKKPNALVIQSGGPTAVINRTLTGLLSGFRSQKSIGHIYGASHGIHGLLNEELIDLGSLSIEMIHAIGHTPGAALGSARLKPRPEDLDRVFEVLAAHSINYLFYIGGNDSAEAAQLIRQAANDKKHDLVIFHLPKTIDNDLVITDHCPGYGSAAKVCASILLGDDLDNKSFYNGIKINVCMGRHAGWLAASTALAKHCLKNEDSEECGPHLIYLPECKFTEEQFLHDVQTTYDRIGRATIVVAEGIAERLKFVGEKDEFGNSQLSGSAKLGEYLEKLVQKNIKVKTELGKLRTRADTWGYMQRSFPLVVSETDFSEAYTIGQAGLRYALQGETDKSLVLIREQTAEYKCHVQLVDLSHLAQKTKTMPNEMINTRGNGVTNLFIEYARPLVGELPYLTDLGRLPLKKKKLSAYVRK